jgi:hypothetical protein
MSLQVLTGAVDGIIRLCAGEYRGGQIAFVGSANNPDFYHT